MGVEASKKAYTWTCDAPGCEITGESDYDFSGPSGWLSVVVTPFGIKGFDQIRVSYCCIDHYVEQGIPKFQP